MSFFSQRWRKFKRRWLPLVVAYLGQGLLGLILKTCRIQVSGLENFQETAKNGKCIMMLWHNRLAPVIQFLKLYGRQFNYGALISKSRDGDLLATLVNRYPQGKAIRVAHDAKHQALRDMIQQLNSIQDIVIVITPDGPRGPSFRVKPGIILAAKAASAKIIPMSWSASRFWKLPTWDELMIPKPFSKVLVSFDTPIEIPSHDSEPLEHHQKQLEEILLKM